MDKMEITPPYFAKHTAPFGGVLPDTDEAHACWYYVRIAMQALARFDEGRALEDDPEVVVRLDAIAWGVARLYGLKDPGEFLRYLRVVNKEAARCALPWDSRLETPLKQPLRKPRIWTDATERELWGKKGKDSQ